MLQTKTLPPLGLADLIQVLQSVADKPGGPFHTWITPKQLRETWSNIDPVVNALIGVVLQQHQVYLPTLSDWFAKQWLVGFRSDFYLSPTPVLYWLSHWWQSLAKHTARPPWLSKLIEQTTAQEAPIWQKLQLLVFHRSFGCLDSETAILLWSQVEKTPQEATPYYRESSTSKKEKVIGSIALDMAWWLYGQTLLYLEQNQTPPPPLDDERATYRNSVFQEVLDWTKVLPRSLQTRIGKAGRKLISQDERMYLGLSAYCIAQSWRGRNEYNNILKLSKNIDIAILFGWIGYSFRQQSLSDNAIWRRNLIPLTHLCLFQSKRRFEEHSVNLPNQFHFGWNLHIDKIFRLMETSEYERLNSYYLFRKHVAGALPKQTAVSERISVTKPHQFANRSIGHTLASTALLLLHPTTSSTSLKNDEHIGCLLLAVSQLADDLHDWELDWQQQTLTPIVRCLMSVNTPPFSLYPTKPDQQQKIRVWFWQNSARNWLTLAEKWLEEAGQRMANNQDFYSPLHPYRTQRSALLRNIQDWLHQLEDTQQFIDAYQSAT